MISVDKGRCPQDHRCPMVPRCPQGAITQEGFNLPQVDSGKCVECMYCVMNCPYEAFMKK